MAKLILSRKGFDSGAGGGPSPRLPDGRLVSIPIPDVGSPITYANARYDGGSYLDLLHRLGLRTIKNNGVELVVDDSLGAHLDPDLILSQRPRASGWRPALGQLGAAQAHLRANGVGVGDLFLFFGLFRDTEERWGQLSFVGPRYHAVWGWLEVGEVVSATMAPRWASDHPHVAAGHLGRYRLGDNTLYIASDTSTWVPGLGGSGILPAGKELVLTTPGLSASKWTVPLALHPENAGATLSFHGDPGRWARTSSHARLRSVGRGQEFIVRANQEIEDWVNSLLA